MLKSLLRRLTGCPNASACALRPQPRDVVRYVEVPARQSGCCTNEDPMAGWK